MVVYSYFGQPFSTSSSLHSILKYTGCATVFRQSIGHANNYSSEKSEPSDTEVSAKKRKICSETPDIENSGDAVTYEKGDASETTG